MTSKMLSLESNETIALIKFNSCCMSLRTNYPFGVYGLINLRYDALKYYIEDNNDVHSLLSALLSLRPHWEFNGSKPLEVIKRYFEKTCGLGEKLVDHSPQLFSAVSSRRFIREMTPKKETPKEIIKELKKEIKIIKEPCVIHPEVKMFNKKRKLCMDCYKKMCQYGLLNHPFDQAVKLMLKANDGIMMCKKHVDRVALPNGFCVPCNKK